MDNGEVLLKARYEKPITAFKFHNHNSLENEDVTRIVSKVVEIPPDHSRASSINRQRT